jgi:TonB-linked SusC/RagA family outer membrane protein
MKKSILLGLALLCLLASNAWAQAVTVTGRVTGPEGSPLPGVTVVEQGTNNGVATGADGAYTLTAQPNATLVFSFIGMETQQVPVNGRNTINVQLGTDAQQLSEVVVTALGVERNRNTLPYSAQQIEGESVTQARNPNFIRGMQGKVAGLNVQQNNSLGGSSNVTIRGTKSLFYNNQALFVVDGVPISNAITNTTTQQTGRGGFDYGNAAADINPDDIASVSVLKGAAATALYGQRAANGVILITTKKGRRGTVGVTVNTGLTMGFVDRSTFPTYQTKYGGGYGKYYEDPSGFFYFRDVDGDGTEDLVTPTSEDASYGARFDPNLMVFQWDAFDPASPNFRKARPWVAGANGPITFFEDAVSTLNSVLVDGGNEQGTFKLGYTRNTDKGILPNSQVNKNIVNFAGSLNLTPKLTTSASVNYSQVDGLGRYGTGYDDLNVMQSFRQWFQMNVDLQEQREAYFRNRQNITWNWADPDELRPIYFDNPYFTRYENFQNDTRNRTFGFAMANYKFTEWFNLMGRVTIDSYDEIQEERRAVSSTGVPEYARYNRTARETNYDLIATVNRTFADDFRFIGLVGTNIRRNHISSIRASTNGGLVVPRLYALSNTLSPLTPPIENEVNIGVDGVFAGLTFGFREIVTLDLTARRDRSTTLPEGNNAYFYPSAAISFTFSELLGETTPWLTYGKLIANYAQVGADAPAYSIADTYDKPTAFGSVPLFSVPLTKNNPDLRPERTKSAEAGIDLAFLESRFGLTFTVYRTNTVDQIIPVNVSSATGYGSRFVNSGEVENRGVEISTYITPIRRDDLTWTINANWSRNRNEVISLYEGLDNILLNSYQGGVTTNATVGRPFGMIRGADYVYNDNGQRIVGANGFYLRTPTANEEIGNPNPDWIGGVSNTLTYKGVSLYFLVDTRYGGQLFSLDRYYGLATGIYAETAGINDLGNESRLPVEEGGGVILPGVKEDGSVNDIRVSNTNYGLYGYRRNPPAGFIYDASFVKLREVSLTYSLPATLMSRIRPFKGIDISLVGRNLWIIHKNLPDSDPEENLGAGNTGIGYQSGAYPTTRNVGFNLRFRL